MGKRLERFGEVGIVDETNGFGLDLAMVMDFSAPHGIVNALLAL